MAEVRVTDPETGGQKGSKPERMDLIPAEAWEELGRVYGFGAQKYADHNWRKGYPWSLSLAAMLRHIAAYQRGEDRDPESGLHHLAHAMFHCSTLIVFEKEQPHKDDRFKSEQHTPTPMTGPAWQFPAWKHQTTGAVPEEKPDFITEEEWGRRSRALRAAAAKSSSYTVRKPAPDVEGRDL
jgi:hypothetical protein